MCRSRSFLWGVVWLVATLSPVIARAEDPEMEAARSYFSKGVELFEKDDFLGALAQFRMADKAHHTPAITYNMARVRESLGQAQEAMETYEAYLAESGSQGDFFDAATVAIAQIKARSTRVRVETQPPGAAVRIDGALMRERSPTTVLLFGGHHRVDVELEGWAEGRDFEAKGSGDSVTIQLTRPAPPVASPPAPRRRTVPMHDFSGPTAGFGFSLNYSALVVNAEAPAVPDPDDPAYRKAAVMFGLMLEAGYGLTPQHVLMLRGNCGLGSTEKALFSLGSLGLTWSYRATPNWWFGAGGISASTDEDIGATYSPLVGADSNDSVKVGSNLALGPMVEAGAVLGDVGTGQWVMSIYPSLLLGTGQGQSTLYVPLVIGHRWY